MDLNDYMYFNGEVLEDLPPGPGSGCGHGLLFRGRKATRLFQHQPGGAWLDDLCYAVEPRPLDARVVPNGLPVFTLYYMNDDDGERKLGRDSKLVFTAPAKGAYFVRVNDTAAGAGTPGLSVDCPGAPAGFQCATSHARHGARACRNRGAVRRLGGPDGRV